MINLHWGMPHNYFLYICIIISLSGVVVSRISDSNELDCNFEFPCQWFNGTNGLEDSIDWGTAQSVSLGTWNNLPILGLSNSSAGNCLDDQMRGSNKAPKLAFSSDCAEAQSITFMATTKSETDVYSYVAGHSGSTAWLVSAEIPKQIGAGVLTFSYWRSKSSPQLRVCGRKPPGYPNAIDCGWYSTGTDFQGQQWVKDRAIIPPSDGPFEIIFVAQITDRNNLISVDDIQYRASLGNEAQANQAAVQLASQTSAKAGPTEMRIPKIGENDDDRLLSDSAESAGLKNKNPSSSGFSLAGKNASNRFRVIIDTQKCPLVACDFDDNLCKFANVATGQWRQSKIKVGNRVTGIISDQNGDGGFAFAAQDSNTDSAFAMSTRPFLTATQGVMTVAYHMSGHTGRLRVCDRSLDNCTVVAENTAESFSQKLLGWQNADLHLAAGSHQLIFVADRIPQNYIVGLDNIQIWDKTRTLELECFSSN